MSSCDKEDLADQASPRVMGGASSKSTRGLVVSLDALGTLYRFREPVAVQYSKIARQCGFKGEYTNDQLNKSFKSAYKEQNKRYPNYGKDELPSPQAWWELLVENTFRPFVTTQALWRPETGQKLYEHFTSGDAYELFEDVRPFIETIAELKKDFADPEGPIVLTGVISNSDPRVRNVLTNLGLRVGVSQAADIKLTDGMRKAWEDAKDMRVTTPVNDMYNSGDHFNFLTTSYEAGSEKPDGHIFAEAQRLAGQLTLSRLFQDNERPSSIQEAWSVVGKARAQTRAEEHMWIHIGDEYVKDYEGARFWGHEALLLDRDGQHKGKENVVTSLDDAAKVISIMAHETFQAKS
jgi:FMN phosphatase YigB (HAD superfamily)